MATRRYGLSKGQTKKDVTEAAGAAVDSDSVELTFDLAAGLSQNELLILIDEIKAHILEDIFPPA